MPVPLAVPAASPIAVLVLAWDEAAPAVRALVAATQARTPTVDSILVLVPQADAPAHLSAKEYRPVSLSAAPPSPKPAAAAPAPPAADSRPDSESIRLQLAINKQVALLKSRPAPAVAAPLAWAAVQVLRLGSLSLPQLAQRAGQPLPAPAWTGPTTPPATPYLGASEPASPPAPAVASRAAVPGTEYFAAQEVPAGPPVAPAPPTGAPPEASAALPPAVPYYEPTETAQAPDPEAELPPNEVDEPTSNWLLISDLNSLSEDDAGTLPLPRAPAQAGWPEALAALRHPALRPAAAHYPAPDLNYQIIQYARFAVPVALAEPPFAVIYAPAWPTWLAAQELRQRTGRPLVVHVATLAADDDESVDIATGWIAELQRQALHRADLILTETPALAQRLRHELGLAFEAVQAVPAADTEAIARALHGARPRPAFGLANQVIAK